MSEHRKLFFERFRKELQSRDMGLTQALVDAADRSLDVLGIPGGREWPQEGDTQNHTLKDPEQFFAGVRKVTGPLNQVQVDSIKLLLKQAAHWTLGQMAYGLATAWHESRFIPQEEWGKGKGKPYGKPGKYGQSQHGRGFVQLTHDFNYEWADKALALGGALLKNFNLALQPGVAAAILVAGMEQGAFNRTGQGIAHYIGKRGTEPEFIAARRTVNVQDKAKQIAKLALEFQDALEAGGWG